MEREQGERGWPLERFFRVKLESGIPVVFLRDSLERRLLEEEVIPLSKSSKGGFSS